MSFNDNIYNFKSIEIVIDHWGALQDTYYRIECTVHIIFIIHLQELRKEFICNIAYRSLQMGRKSFICMEWVLKNKIALLTNTDSKNLTSFFRIDFKAKKFWHRFSAYYLLRHPSLLFWSHKHRKKCPDILHNLHQEFFNSCHHLQVIEF